MQTVKRREGTMQMCLNNFHRNLVKMAEVFFVVRHFELACEQLAAGKEREKKEFPNTGDVRRVQINYSGRKHNHTEIRVICISCTATKLTLNYIIKLENLSIN